MKLYTMPGACSLSCHIALQESKLPFDVVVCEKDSKERWVEVEKLNPMGVVPVLVLDDGKPLTQNIAILAHVAEKAPQAKLLPEAGSPERARAFEWLSFTGADLHKSFAPIFMEAPEPEQKKARERIRELLGIADGHLAGRQFLAGDGFTVADAYFFVVARWAQQTEIPLDALGTLTAYLGRIGERPAVKTAMKREGLLRG